ncbi:mechanosensitive ion channel [Leptolyngbya cf. ectocarpi LEGE 11479]|uniref:Mechanosensitive ion channel n=1 Tax=Leptolyngbya cf. ectocarpi LEGE 11479 TaxID=1828722 RepID=A0A928ZPD5_LEPEC|nr:mechanosensitive ion channel domain-containing protein [Leptolyngbya ectocarpi]MBE9065065.1 mechanosensitive ion channel [Leptolyngbya cf. ectocarpi LEGE 11479]
MGNQRVDSTHQVGMDNRQGWCRSRHGQWSRWVQPCRIIWQLANIALVTILVTALLNVQPAGIAQSQPAQARADVVIDGRVLFQLDQIDTVSAQRRADVANEALWKVLENAESQPTPSPIRVRTREQEGLVTVRANGRHLLTVTSRDLMAGVLAQDQADGWAGELQAALDRAQKERRPTYQRQMAWVSGGASAIALAIWALLYNGRRWLWRRQTRTGKKLPMWLLPFLLGAQVVVWLATAVYICELFPAARSMRYRIFQFLERTFTGPLFDIDGQDYSLVNLFQLVLLTLALWIGVRIVTSAVKSRFLTAAIPNRGVQDAIATLMQVVLTGLGLFLILQVLGIDLSALAILASVLGVGLGLGLQHIANNIVSGWVMLLERSIQVGDFINLGDLAGTVENIGARSTEIRTLDRVAIIVPNAELLENKVINWSHGHPVSQLHLPIGVAYNSDIRQVHDAVMEVAHTHPSVLQYPQPRLRFLGFGDSSLDFDVLVWIRDPRLQFDLKSDLYYMLEANFRHYDIQIPFPQRDLNIRSPQLDLAAWPQQSAQNDPSRLQQPQKSHHGSPELNDLLAHVRDYSSLLKNQQGVQEALLERLVKQMRSQNGLIIQNRRFRLTVYSSCFVGSEAVTWLTQTQNATREAAVRIGQAMVEQGIFHHVSDEHPFKDEYLFYRFYEDEA